MDAEKMTKQRSQRRARATQGRMIPDDEGGEHGEENAHADSLRAVARKRTTEPDAARRQPLAHVPRDCGRLPVHVSRRLLANF